MANLIAQANLAQSPVSPEQLPDPNQVMTQEQWITDVNNVDDLLEELRTSHLEEANIQRFEQEGRLDAQNAFIRRQEVALRRYGDPSNPQGNSIYERLTGLVGKTNSTAMLKHLNSRVADAQDDFDITHGRVHGRLGEPGAIANTVTADKRFTTEAVTLGSVLRQHGVGPDKEQLRVEATAYSNAAGAASKAGGARTERGAAERSKDRLGDFDQSLEWMVQNISAAHNQRRQEIGNRQQNIDGELVQWNLLDTQPANPMQEQAIRSELSGLQTYLDTELSPFDGLRAESLANYTRARYRLESRTIQDSALHGGNQPNTRYTLDRGILVADNAGNETVIYDDGSTATFDPIEDRGIHRRWASGEPHPGEPQIRLDMGVETDAQGRPLRNHEDVFSEWERNRTPEAATEAHAALSYYIEQQRDVEAQGLAAIQGYQDAITGRRNQIAQINQAATDEGRALTTAEQQDIANANQQIANLQARRRTAQQDVLTARSEISPANYWKNYLEAGTARTATQTRGRFLTKQVVAPVEGLRPDMRHDGVVVAYDTLMHGRRGEWRMWPDGYAIYRDPNTGVEQRFNPNGTPA